MRVIWIKIDTISNLDTQKYEPRCENRSSGFPTRSDTNRAVQPQKMARGLKFCIYEVEELY